MQELQGTRSCIKRESAVAATDTDASRIDFAIKVSAVE